MHAFDDVVSYTRIIDPEPAGEDLVIPAKGERPSLVWRPRLGEDQTYELSGRHCARVRSPLPRFSALRYGSSVTAAISSVWQHYQLALGAAWRHLV